MFSHFSSSVVAAFALILLGAGAAHAQTAPSLDIISDSLTLDGTLRSVLDANPAITTLDELANAANGRLAQTRTGFLPQVTGTATYTRIDPVVKLPFGGETLQLAPNNNYDAHITAQYLLLDFGKSDATVKLAESQVQTAKDNINVTRRDLAFNARRL